jgi:hypothetical protein
MIESGPLPLRAAHDKRWSALARRSGHAAQRNFSSKVWQRSLDAGGLTPNQLVGTEKWMRQIGQMSLCRQRLPTTISGPPSIATLCGRDIKPEVGTDVFDVPEAAIEIEAKAYSDGAGRHRPTTALVSFTQLANYAN